jgi:glycosyltransferase involved in cell wall biosynthesis
LTLRVLFMQSQAFFGSDSGIHARYMRYFPRDQVEVYAACSTERMPNPDLTSLEQLRKIPDLHVRPTNFGPSTFGTTGAERARLALGAAPAAADLLGLASYIRRNRIQILHGTEKPRDALYGVLLGKLTGAKSIVHLHVGFEDWLTSQAKWAIRHADAVVGVSRFVAQTAVDAGVPGDRVYSVVNSLDNLDRWDPNLDGRATRQSLGIPLDAPVIGINARLYKWKGHGYVLDAAAIAKREFPDLRVLISGEDDPRSHPGGGSYRTELEAQANRLGLGDHVIFTGFRTDIAALLSAIDVYAMPSWEEPCAVAFLEAMAMAKPVVSWRSGGTPELVANGKTGLLAPRGDTNALAANILTLLRHPELRRTYGEAGRRRVVDVLNPQRMCQEMVEVYRSTLSAPRRRSLLPVPA